MKTFLRWTLFLLLLTTALLHLLAPQKFQSAMPPQIPYPTFIILFTGYCELAAAITLQIPKLRKLTAWLLILFFLAIFPANIYMALHPDTALLGSPLDGPHNALLLYLRLPFQIPLILWAWWYTK